MPDPVVLRAGFSPIKGTRHLSLEQVTLDQYGAAGDRRLCLVDVTARRVLRTVQHPALTAVDAREHDGVLSVTLPDGRGTVGAPAPTAERLVCDYWGRPAELTLLGGPHGALLSDYLGKPVTLASAPPRAVVYGAGVSLVTRSSLDDLAARAGTATAVDPARFRATFVIDTGDGPGTEDEWAGRELRLGTALVRVGGGIGRCAVIDIDPSTGERGSRLLRTLAAYRPRNPAGEPCFGVYADVIGPGVVIAPSGHPLRSP
ncbi:MOSC domain-containing protein [Nocardioides sp. Iso805N]|uniref:MOSC domain-containing protein n=1 Tax=Nocardioides sp. Iso805N TaxID=1283287 RepID=UPI00037D7CAE|nr:MOSC N-terminal beta barrel domain-containing protein [Nocardioides sp. Iso805N]